METDLVGGSKCSAASGKGQGATTLSAPLAWKVWLPFPCSVCAITRARARTRYNHINWVQPHQLVSRYNHINWVRIKYNHIKYNHIKYNHGTTTSTGYNHINWYHGTTTSTGITVQPHQLGAYKVCILCVTSTKVCHVNWLYIEPVYSVTRWTGCE